MRRGAGVTLLAALLLAPAPPARAAELDYTHWAEAALGMLFADLFSPYADAIIYGESSTTGIDQYALLITGDRSGQDDGEKNVVVFECGMHAREWYAVESCYWLADYLLDNRTGATVSELLDHVDVWIISHTNPAGRDLDDPALGDPTEYVFVCRGGSDEGDACATSADCSGGTCYDTGWRTNANTSSCAAGVDLARNFSSGWDAGSECGDRVCENSRAACSSDADCAAGEDCDSIFMKFHGDDPFSEPESQNLRRFINNHLVSAVAIVHANSEDIWHRSSPSSDAADYQLDQAWALNDAGSAGWTPDPSLEKDSVGGGVGQFSAWLTSRSDVAGEWDEDTERNIPTWFFEMPISESSSGYSGTRYQEAASDGSNSFHPSADDMEDLWEDALRDSMLEVIRQARSPFCPVDSAGARVTAECETNDFGLIGAKIANAPDEPGILDVDPDDREETAPAGTHEVVFTAQNFSSGAAVAATNATITIDKNGVVVATYIVPVSLAGGDRGLYSVSHAFTGGRLVPIRYRVTFQLDGDDYSSNNKKVFRFRVGLPIHLTPQLQLALADPPRLIDPPDSPDLPKWIELRARFPRLDKPLDPRPAGVEIEIEAFPPFLEGAPRAPESVIMTVPGGKYWQRGRGAWVFEDPDGKFGPVRRLRLGSLPTREGEPELDGVQIQIGGKAGARLKRARVWSTDFTIGAGSDKELPTRLTFVTALEEVTLEPRKRQAPGKAEPEDEPDQEPVAGGERRGAVNR